MSLCSQADIASLPIWRQGGGDVSTSGPVYGMQIATLALWLSVGVAGVLGIVLRPEARQSEWVLGEPTGVLSAELMAADLSADEGDPNLDESSEESMQEWAEVKPPAMSSRFVIKPLPEIPEIPVLPAKPIVSTEAIASAQVMPQPQGSGVVADSSKVQAPRVQESPPKPRRSSSSGASGSSSGSGQAERMAMGTMPAPGYPMEARRRGQEGTVVVEFTVGEDGRVVAAQAKAPSPWPLLNQEALRAVQRWKFPPGAVMKMQRPIVFQLR